MTSNLWPKALQSLRILSSRRDWIYRILVRSLVIQSFNSNKHDKSENKVESNLLQSEERKAIKTDAEEEREVKLEDVKMLPFRRKGSIIKTSNYVGLAEYEEKSRFEETATKKIKRVLKYDWIRMKERWKTQLGFEFTSELHKYYHGPTHTDILIIGGGAMGSSCAYWLKEKMIDIEVLIVEKDLRYREASGPLFSQGLCQQFSLPENIEMSLYGAEFLRYANRHLAVDELPKIEINFEPYGCLILASEKGAEVLHENSRIQNSYGVRNVLLTPRKLKRMFPWLKTDGIALGCLGLEKEGWFDPWMVMLGFKTKALSLGADYINGEVVGFQYHNADGGMHYLDDRFRSVRGVLVKRPNGECHVISFAYCVIAAGAESGFVGALAGMGLGAGVLKVPLPIESRKCYLFNVSCPNGPGLNTPFTVDPSGISFRRNGLKGYYSVTTSPALEEPKESKTDEFCYQFFNDKVLPFLAHRVPSFKNLTLESSLVNFREYNSFDMNGIIGRHPLFSNVLFACGFHGVQHAPAVGRAISELILNNSFSTIDLSRLNFSRLVRERPIFNKNVI